MRLLDILEDDFLRRTLDWVTFLNPCELTSCTLGFFSEVGIDGTVV